MQRSRPRCIFFWAVCGIVSSSLAPTRPSFGDESGLISHGDWPFDPPIRQVVPEVKNDSVLNPIDAFIVQRLEAEGLQLNCPEDLLRLLRRVTFDLTGLPPTISEQEAFLADDSDQAYERVVDRLLASPQFGARWAQHWLDVVRFAETDGFKSDELRPNAFRYRDYVINSFNSDRPYDEFVRQQLAGDELEPENPQALVATGLNRLFPDEDNAANLFQRRQEILDDITETTGLAFLGLTMGCAQCHDHKFDEILQEDYFRLQAFFAPLVERDDMPLASREERQAYQVQYVRWENKTREIRSQIDALLADERAEAIAYSLSKFEPAIQECFLTAPDQRTPYQKQIARIAKKQVDKSCKPEALAKKLPQEKQTVYQKLDQQLAKFDDLKPAPLPCAMAITDLGQQAPPTYMLDGGSWQNPLDEVQPGFPNFLEEADPVIKQVSASSATSGRRAALADWLTSGHHPLTARVIVNRLWHHHFGRGIVGTPNDFGVQGDPPTHPELLDWLAIELVEKEWSLKHIHRLIVTSATYRQSSKVDPTSAEHRLAVKVDPANHLWWHAQRRRLEGETIRDALLSVSGRLNSRMFGESARPELPQGASKRYAWTPDKRIEDQRRRSIFVFAKRNMRFPMFDSFDLPDMHNSCGCRTQSTTPPQALMMLNGDDALALASEWAGDLHANYAREPDKLIQHAYATAFGRKPSHDEQKLAQEFLFGGGEAAAESQQNAVAQGAVTDFCHALMNSNEFIYVD